MRICYRDTSDQKWYERPVAERKRVRPRYMGNPTQEPYMRHLLTLQQMPLELMTLNQWYRPWILSCMKGCGLRKEFSGELLAHTYMDKIWQHECAGAVTRVLGWALESVL